MLIATENAVFSFSSETGDAEPRPVLQDVSVTAVAEGEHHWVYAVGNKVVTCFQGQQGARARVDHNVDSLLMLAEQPLRVLVGTSEAHLYGFDAHTGQCERIEAFDSLPCRKDWYTPWGGPPSVRSLALSPDGQTIYADIHVGSIIRSKDGGESWAPVTPQLHEDVHQVATCAAAPKRVYANTASAVFVSRDCGQSWMDRGATLNHRYGRAVAIHPHDPDCLLATVSDGPHGGNGQLYRTDDEGQHWTHVTNGFPASTERNIDTFQVVFVSDGTAWASVEKTLYRSLDRGRSWMSIWSAPQRIMQLAGGF